ncbi:zinc finger protein 525-like isoform X2 [Drosophila guanche]|uniref:zinc finger protein 525-like isoform X2 n=1 Tax=Drosophila guanche TaxID=7266 RepID=UPI0014722026|nr:zinc finger protein 525-like isoform X2 [Drosophila guanche]
MDDKCRVCMGTSRPLTNIFDETQKWDTCLADMIAQCTGYVVRRGDSLSENICPPCLEDAVSSFNLKKTCEQSHQLYFSLMEEDKEDPSDNQEDETIEISESEDKLSGLSGDEKIHRDKDLVLRFKCPQCPKSYMRKNSLQYHIRMHSGDRPYKCSFCLKSFPQKFRLDSHTRTHTGDRPYHCSECPKSFILKAELKVHIYSHTGGQPYKCSYCSKCFSQAGTLAVHTYRTHTGERAYKCSE